MPKHAVSCLSWLSCVFLRYLITEAPVAVLSAVASAMAGPSLQRSLHGWNGIIVSCFMSELFLNQVSSLRLGALLLTVLDSNIEVTSI